MNETQFSEQSILGVGTSTKKRSMVSESNSIHYVLKKVEDVWTVFPPTVGPMMFPVPCESYADALQYVVDQTKVLQTREK